MMPAMVCLAVSTILNAIYFMKTVIRIYTPTTDSKYESIKLRNNIIYAVTIAAFIALNIGLGVNSHPVVEFIRYGLEMFS